MSKNYIHYGNSVFNPKLISCKHDTIPNKPGFGLWASKIDAEFGWKQWCLDEDFHLDRLNTNLKFVLTNNAKILKVDADHLYEIQKYFIYDRVKHIGGWWIGAQIDFDKIIFDGYDAIEYDHISLMGEAYRNSNEEAEKVLSWFYGWDCDSIVIFNPEIVNVIK